MTDHIFISYAHEDVRWKDEFERMLSEVSSKYGPMGASPRVRIGRETSRGHWRAPGSDCSWSPISSSARSSSQGWSWRIF